MITFIGIVIGMFAISVMQLVLATAMPYIVTEIGGEQLYSWVFSSYMLASLLTIPIFSKLADLYGKKKFYLLGMGIFAIGTLLWWAGFHHGVLDRRACDLRSGCRDDDSHLYCSDFRPIFG